MAKSSVTKISHNGHTYGLQFGGWLNHRYGDASKALFEIYTNDIRLPDMTVGEYKSAKNAEYEALENKRDMTFMKYLKQSFKSEYGYDWDESIEGIKKAINDSCIPYLLRQKKDASVNERSMALFRAADNGHVASTYFIATALSDGKEEECLSWLTLAHNRGHIGAAYDMAAYFDQIGNTVDSLRCLIISADSGFDIAYMNLFSMDLLKRILSIQEGSKLDSMLNELIDGSHNSCARYFKAVRLLVGDTPAEGVSLLKRFRQNPKKKPADKDIDDVYYNQVAFTEEFADAVLSDISSKKHPLMSLMERSLEFANPDRANEGKSITVGFNDFRELVGVVKKERLDAEV